MVRSSTGGKRPGPGGLSAIAINLPIVPIHHLEWDLQGIVRGFDCELVQ
jgi:hypothetical protein